MDDLQVADFKEKTILITGATNGLGKQTAEYFAPTGATLVIVGRNPEKTETLVRSLQAKPGAGSIHGLIADLSSQDEIRRLADAFKKQFTRLDILLTMRALYSPNQTADGYEQTFALNHLNYFY